MAALRRPFQLPPPGSLPDPQVFHQGYLLARTRIRIRIPQLLHRRTVKRCSSRIKEH